MAKDLVRTRRYVQKFYQMRTQLQAVGLRIQTLRSNEQMAVAMRGATRVRSLSLITSPQDSRCSCIGYGIDEPWPQSTPNTTHHDGV